MKRLVFLLGLALVSVTAEASFGDWLLRLFSDPSSNYGAWECSSCTIPIPGTPNSVEAIPDITIFIYAINDEIHSNERISR